MERLRDVEAAGSVFPGVVDAEVVEFLSGTTASHPDVLLQARLQEALDAKTAADIRVAALKVGAPRTATLPRAHGITGSLMRCLAMASS